MLKGNSKDILPRMADPRKFAQQGISIEGLIAVAELPRLASALADDAAEVMAELEFSVAEEGRKVLRGRAKVQVQVVCQRCLDSMPLDLQVELNLAVVWDEDQAVTLPKYLDPWIHGEGPADLYSTIEEELLLDLPMVSYHEDECVARERFQSGEIVESPEPVDNPFQMLKQLKGTPK
tara:strand:+ start:6153 stop:6686 length:534 start_codon:yes stop_codon:yes gene_type:complete